MRKVSFIVDKRTEFIAIVLYLSQCNDYVTEHFRALESDYHVSMRKNFTPFINTKSITLAQKLGETENGFTFDNCIRIAFLLESDFSYLGRWDNYFDNEFSDKKSLMDFLSSIKDLAKLSKFENFYNSNLWYYKTKLNELNAVFDAEKFCGTVNSFFNKNNPQVFCVNYIPTLINANHGFDSEDMLYANIGSFSENLKDVSSFDKGYQHIIIHEFMHNFVNPLLSKHSNEQIVVNTNLKEYNNRFSYISETVTRALTIKIRELMTGNSFDKLLLQEKRNGFDLVEKVYAKLDEYTHQDLSWEEYFPCIINLFGAKKSHESIKQKM